MLDEALIQGERLEDECARVLGGARGAVFTPSPEARLLAVFGLAHAAVRRGGPSLPDSLAALLLGRPSKTLARALDGLAVLDPACGAGALLVAAHVLASGVGARLRLFGIEIAPLATEAASKRSALLGANLKVVTGDALRLPWPAADLVLANPPFLRHEAIPKDEKRLAVLASGLPAQADLSAHFASLALGHTSTAALVWPRALFVSRSARSLIALAQERGDFVLRLRSRVAGSFAASVDTLLVVWARDASGASAAEASVPLRELRDSELVALARGVSSARVRIARPKEALYRSSVPLSSLCDVRFGMKSGCNGFFHLTPRGTGRYYSRLLDAEVSLPPMAVAPLLSSLREALAPAVPKQKGVLFRPGRKTSSPAVLRYVREGEKRGVHLRPTCAQRDPWWLMAPNREPAPLLYPAKVGARAFAFVNTLGLFEDKKWHALFPKEEIPVWTLALALCATPVRLAIDEHARQLTGSQAIADVDTGVLARAPVPSASSLHALAIELAPLKSTLLEEPISTQLEAMLLRPAQHALDLAVGRVIGMSAREVDRSRLELLARVRTRLAHAASIRDRSL